MRVLLDDVADFHADGTATITKRSGLSGKTNSRTMQLTFTQYEDWVERGMLIQDAMPHLPANDREFLMTGITPEEWKENFGSEE